MASLHIPVLLNEVLESLVTNEKGIYVDGTFGAGGYTSALLKKHPEAKVIAIDKDPSAIKGGVFIQKLFENRLFLHQDSFANLLSVLEQENLEKVDGIVVDLGVSSMQIDQADRGFSFKKDGPLDMRMSQEGQSAADVVNTMKEKELADILYLYGEERASYRIASAIVKARQKAPITRTLELAEIVHHVMPRPKKKEIDSATRTFQALRIYVNKELQDLETLLSSSLEALKPNGRLCVVSFHSLEDRIVKTFMVKNSREYEATSRYLPLKEKKQAFLRLINKKPILPGAEELSSNSRSHSAKLRVAERRGDE